MNIRLAYDADFHSFQTLFPEIQLYDKKDKSPIDLLIFSGGADVGLEYYMGGDGIDRFKNLVSSSVERDRTEQGILYDALNSKYVGKILGVCRGVQFLNVMFSGTLYPDLGSVDLQHHHFHGLSHLVKNKLSFMTKVNSMHHQALRNKGTMVAATGNNTNPKVLAIEPKTGIVEIISWMDDKVLGIQFHPEYYDNTHPDKIKLREILYSWMEGNERISE